MLPPQVRFRLPEGRLAVVPAGGLVGRSVIAACRLEDGRVSEAHLLISLRGRELLALRLRGGLWVEGEEEEEVELHPGLRLMLAPGLELEVESVVLPSRVLALHFGNGRCRELCAPTYSFVGSELVVGWVAEAEGWLWSTAEGWRLRWGNGPAQEVKEGQQWSRGGECVQVVALRVEDLEAAWTQNTFQSLLIVSRVTSVQIQRRRLRPVMLDGIPARILAELGEVRGPLPWNEVASQIWKKEEDRTRLRRYWDRGVRRLRIRLREAGIREDLVRADGLGGFELVLYPGDRFVEEEEV